MPRNNELSKMFPELWWLFFSPVQSLPALRINFQSRAAFLAPSPWLILKTQLDVSTSRSRLYQRPYYDAFDLVPYSVGWRVSDFVKFSDDDNRLT